MGWGNQGFSFMRRPVRKRRGVARGGIAGLVLGLACLAWGAPAFAEEAEPAPASGSAASAASPEASPETPPVETPGPARSDREPQAEPLSLESLLRNARSRNAQIKEAEADIEIARAQLDRARAAMFPTGKATVLAAPLPEMRGDPQSSTTNWGKWGPLVLGTVELAQPLYTFGQIGSYKRAAEQQIEANTGLAHMKRDEVLFRTKEMYYGYRLASSLDDLVEELIDFLEEASVEAEKQLKNKKSKIKPKDVYELNTQLETLRQLKLQASAARQTAEKAVSWITATPFDNLPKEKLAPESYEKRTLDDYLALAKSGRPELKALTAGLQARAALRDAKRAQSYPVLFLGGTLGFSWSPVADRQQSIFANDPFNRVLGGVGLGLRFDLEFSRHAAEAAEQEAERIKLKAKQDYAVPGIELEVKKAYYELEQASQGLEVADRRRKLARKWFVSSASGWSIGITPARDLMDALEADGLAKKNYFETVYALNLALANLSRVVGKEITSLQY